MVQPDLTGLIVFNSDTFVLIIAEQPCVFWTSTVTEG